MNSAPGVVGLLASGFVAQSCLANPIESSHQRLKGIVLDRGADMTVEVRGLSAWD